MKNYSILEAKEDLANICDMLASGKEDYFVIYENGKPVAKMLPYNKRIGVLENVYKYSDKFDDDNEEISEMIFGI